MRKIHFSVNDALDPACGRVSSLVTNNTFNVTCNSCIIRNSFQEAHQQAILAKQNAFVTQIPRRISEPWRDGNIVCECGNDTFRIGDRSCYGHYDNYHCAECGEIQSRLTETGMSF